MVVFHTDAVGLSVTVCVYILLFYADYAVVYQVIEYGKHPSTLRSFQALFAHLLVVMAVIAHIRTMLSDPGYVPLPTTKIDFSSDLENFLDINTDHKQQQKKKKKIEPPPMDEWTICTKCETYRPPRSHHCRKCNRCVRRMDHHCPWMNNCIGELNWKYFYLFVVYIGLFCLYSLILIARDWYLHYNNDSESVPDKVMTVILFFEAIIFGMFVTAVGTGQTIAIMCDRNALEIRRYGAPTHFPKTPRMKLLQAVCGRGPRIFWLLPCIRPRIPDPVPPSKFSRSLNTNSVENV